MPLWCLIGRRDSTPIPLHNHSINTPRTVVIASEAPIVKEPLTDCAIPFGAGPPAMPLERSVVVVPAAEEEVGEGALFCARAVVAAAGVGKEREEVSSEKEDLAAAELVS